MVGVAVVIVVITVTFLACCKVSGNCSRAEEEPQKIKTNRRAKGAAGNIKEERNASRE